jgi:rhodanese-related sulfurtransferase
MYNFFQQKAYTYKNLSPEEFKLGFEKENSILLDVRTPLEFKEGKISNSMNIDILGDNFVQKLEKLPKNKPIYVYCKSGRRSRVACEKLNELGFEEVYNLDAGILSWPFPLDQ